MIHQVIDYNSSRKYLRIKVIFTVQEHEISLNDLM